MIKLLSRKPRRTLRRLADRKHPVARIVRDTRDAARDLPMWLPDALELFAKGKLQKLTDIGGPNEAFCSPMNYRQQIRGEIPALSPDALALIGKAQNAGAKL